MKIWFSLSVFFAGMILGADEITLAENGVSKAVIVIPEPAKPIVKFAAKELADHLKIMTGADFPVGIKPGPDVNIFLGFGEAENFTEDEYVIRVKGKRIDMYGKDTSKDVYLFNYYLDNPDKGTLRSVYNFLDSLGVRWLAPGRDGAHVPERKTLRIPEQDIHFKPYFRDRKMKYGWNFMNIHPDGREYVKSDSEFYLWGLRNNGSTRLMVCGAHSEHALGLYNNPEWLAHPSAHQMMKNGTRNPNHSCWTDPYTKEIWIRAAEGYFSGKSPRECGFNVNGYLGSPWPYPFLSPDEFMIDPLDYYSGNDGRCWCPRCQEFRKNHPCADDTEIIWQVLGDIARHVEEKYPGRFISTLIYPPKELMPKTIEKPGNIRIRICMSGPRNLTFPEKLAADLNRLKGWGEFLGPKNIPLWVYQCTCNFGGFLPAVPESYPHLTAKFIETVRPLCAGMYWEIHTDTFTLGSLDSYIYQRLMWNPDRSVEQEMDEYFHLYYGPAAVPAKALFAMFENNWIRIDREILVEKKQTIGSVGQSPDYFRRKIWSQIYTPEEMKKMEALIQQIELLSPAGSVYAKRAGLLRKYVLDPMLDERGQVMDKEKIRSQLKLDTPGTDAADFPPVSEWEKAPAYSLVPAQRFSPDLSAPGSFRVMSSGNTLFIRAELKDPAIAESKTDLKRQSGDQQSIWKDNCIELFFYAEKRRKFWQIIVNDNNAWSARTRDSNPIRWEQMNGLKAATVRNEDGWTAEIAVPLSELKTDRTDLRFNLARERNIKGQPTEYSTWSPLATLGNWHSPDNYGTLIFESEK